MIKTDTQKDSECPKHPDNKNHYWEIETLNQTNNQASITGECLKCGKEIRKELNQPPAGPVSLDDLKEVCEEIRSDHKPVYGKCLSASLGIVEWCHGNGIPADNRRFAIIDTPSEFNLSHEPAATHHAVLLHADYISGTSPETDYLLVDVTLDQFHTDTDEIPSQTPESFPQLGPKEELGGVNVLTKDDPELTWYVPVPLTMTGTIAELKETDLFNKNIHPTHPDSKRQR